MTKAKAKTANRAKAASPAAHEADGGAALEAEAEAEKVDVDRHFRAKPKAKASVKVKAKPGSTRFISNDELRGNPEAIGQAIMGNHLNKLSWSRVRQDESGYTVEGWPEKRGE